MRAYGRQWRIRFGTNHEGWNADRARVELDVILEKIKRGTWEPPSKRREEREELDPNETVRVTAYRWWQRRKTDLARNTRLDYQWRLDHLVRHLGDEETAGMDARWVDDWRQKLVGQGLSARSVNMVLDLLAQVLDDAVEYKLLDANPARGKRRRMKVSKARRSFLEPDMVVDLLDELRAHLAAIPARLRDSHGAAIPIFPTRTGGRLNASNVRNRLLNETVRRVNTRREKDGRMVLPDRVTPHTLRRTFASLALAAGRDPRWVMGQLGQTDARLTLNLYAQAMQRQRVDGG